MTMVSPALKPSSDDTCSSCAPGGAYFTRSAQARAADEVLVANEVDTLVTEVLLSVEVWGDDVVSEVVATDEVLLADEVLVAKEVDTLVAEMTVAVDRVLVPEVGEVD